MLLERGFRENIKACANAYISYRYDNSKKMKFAILNKIVNTCSRMDNVKKTPADHLKVFRFTSANQPVKNGRHKGSTPTDWLRKLSRTKIDFLNPLTGKTEKGMVNLVVAIQLILKATQDSDLPSIREYFDRIDGKVMDKTEHSGAIEHNVFIENIVSKAIPNRIGNYVSDNKN